MDVCKQFTVGVSREALGPPANPLFTALASLFPVTFRPLTNGDCHGLDALILTGLDQGGIRRAARSGLPVLAVPGPPSTPSSNGTAKFRLGQSPALSACLRGHHFEERESLPAATIPTTAGDVVLASRDGEPIWLRRSVEGTDVTLVRWPLPRFAARDHIYENFQSSRFLRLLPLLQFIRDLTRQEDWKSPPTPACLLVDDPNLHSRAYGHLDFRRLAADAAEQHFYVSVATVPLDSWWINSETRDLFRENAPRISILPHGNNHTHDELARPASDEERLSLLAQALQRFRRLEQSGMEVCRVMECPHGALSLAMLEPMARLGYDAVFASTAHLLRCNGDAAFPLSLGAECTLFEKNVVPVIPRIRVGEGWETEVRLAAFLHQPLILAAHHWDFADESHLAGDFAAIVNSLPDVCWASPTGVARACYQYRQTGNVLHIKLESRLTDIPVPHSVRWMMAYRPWLKGAEQPEVLVIRQGSELLRVVSSADVIGPIRVPGRSNLQVSSSLMNTVDYQSVPPPRFRSWPLVRKVMVEVRDRSRLAMRLRGQSRKSEAHAGERSAAGER